MITDRIPFGVLEMKSGWVIDDSDRNRSLTTALARSGCNITALLDCQFCMATAAAYVLNRWRSSGGVVAAIPATPYPDERYQTKMIWWDRRDFVNHAEPAAGCQDPHGDATTNPRVLPPPRHEVFRSKRECPWITPVGAI